MKYVQISTTLVLAGALLVGTPSPARAGVWPARTAGAQVRVPDVRLQRLDRAQDAIKRAGLKSSDYDALPDDNRASFIRRNWIVVIEKPGPGQRIAKGKTVQLGRLKSTEVKALVSGYDSTVETYFPDGLPYPGKKRLVGLAVAFCERLDKISVVRPADFNATATRLASTSLTRYLPTATAGQRQAVAAVLGSEAIGPFCSSEYSDAAPLITDVAAALKNQSAATTSPAPASTTAPTTTTYPAAANDAKAAEALRILDRFQGTTWRAQITNVEVGGPTGGVVLTKTTLGPNDVARAVEIAGPAAGNLLNTRDVQSLGFQVVYITASDGNPLAHWWKGELHPQPGP